MTINEPDPTAHAEAHVEAHSEEAHLASAVIADGVQQGIDSGVRTSRIRLNDRRAIFIYLFLVLFVVLTTLWQQQQTRRVEDALQASRDAQAQSQAAIINNCNVNNNGNAHFNSALDQLTKNAVNSTALTTAQKDQALKAYADLHLPIADCSQLAVLPNKSAPGPTTRITITTHPSTPTSTHP